MRSLDSKVVAITGAAGGIGAALAEAFGQRGARIALLDIDASGLAARQAHLGGLGIRASVHPTDVRIADSLVAARDGIVAEHGGVDVLVNNAGVTCVGAFAALPPAEIERLVAINWWGVVHGCRVFMPALTARSEAHIVNTASEAGLAGMPLQTIYCATKFAVRGFTASLRAELAGERIGVTCLLPGATATNIIASAPSTEPAISDELSKLLARHGPKPTRLARKVVRAVRRNKAEVFAGPDSWALDWGVRFAPGLVRWSMRRAASQARRRGVHFGPKSGAPPSGVES